MKTKSIDILEFSKATVINLEFVAPFKSTSPYRNRRARTLAHFRRKPGCYIIREDDAIVYVGMSSSDVVEACYRHLYEWNERYALKGRHRVTYEQQLRLGEKQYEIQIIPTDREQAQLLERALIMFLNPRDNKERYERVIEELVESRTKDKVEDNGREIYVPNF